MRGRAVETEYLTDADGADPGRRVWPTALAAALVGLVLGVLVGLGVSATQAKTYQATTSVSVLPDPDLTGGNDNNNPVVTQDATAFIQSQLVVLNGAELSDRVRAEVRAGSSSNVDATQIGQTYVVSIVASAGTRADALAIAARTASDFDALRTGQLVTQINALLTSTNTQLGVVRTSLGGSRTSGAPLTPSQTALQSEYERLLSQRSSLTGLKAGSAGIVTVVAPARDTSTGLSGPIKDALIGALVGVLAGLAVFVIVRRSVRRIRTVADLAGLGLPALLPVQSRRPMRRRGGASRPDAAARLLAARLDPELTTGDPIAFVGAAGAVGVDQLSLALAAALTDRGPVLYLPRAAAGGRGRLPWLPPLDSGDIDAAAFAALLEPGSVAGVLVPRTHSTTSGADETPTRVSRTAHLASVFRQARRHGYVVVIEPDPVADTDMAIDCGRAGASIVLVASRDATSPSDVVVATELFAAQSVTVLGAVLNEPPWLGQRLVVRTRTRRAEAARADAGRRPVDEPPPRDRPRPPDEQNMALFEVPFSDDETVPAHESHESHDEIEPSDSTTDTADGSTADTADDTADDSAGDTADDTADDSADDSADDPGHPGDPVVASRRRGWWPR